MSSAEKSSGAATCYFTCTLGEAIGRSPGCSDLQTIDDFIDYQAKTYPEDIVVGFPVPGTKDHNWSYELFSTTA